MTRLIRLFRGWLQDTEPGTAMALVRVAVGLTLLHTLGSLVWTDVGRAVLVTAAEGGYKELSPSDWRIQALGGPTWQTAQLLLGLGLIGSAMLVAGVGGRVATFGLLQVMIALFRVNAEAGGGHDRLLTNTLWLLVLSRADVTLSLTCRWRTGRWTSDEPVASWPRYLVIWQLVLMYWATGVQKLGAEWMPWGDFQALYWALLLPTWRRWDMSWVGHVYPLTQLATVGTLVFEWGAPIWVLAAWYRRTRAAPGRLRALFNRLDLRRVWAALGVGLHLGIALFMNVGPFSWASLAMYPALFHHDEIAAFARRLRAQGAASTRS